MIQSRQQCATNMRDVLLLTLIVVEVKVIKSQLLYKLSLGGGQWPAVVQHMSLHDVLVHLAIHYTLGLSLREKLLAITKILLKSIIQSRCFLQRGVKWPWNPLQTLLAYHINDIQWYTMIYNDIQWYTMIYNDIQWYTYKLFKLVSMF